MPEKLQWGRAGRRTLRWSAGAGGDIPVSLHGVGPFQSAPRGARCKPIRRNALVEVAAASAMPWPRVGAHLAWSSHMAPYSNETFCRSLTQKDTLARRGGAHRDRAGTLSGLDDAARDYPSSYAPSRRPHRGRDRLHPAACPRGESGCGYILERSQRRRLAAQLSGFHRRKDYIDRLSCWKAVGRFQVARPGCRGRMTAAGERLLKSIAPQVSILRRPSGRTCGPL